MNNFAYSNPVKIFFGKNTIPKLRDLIPPGQKVMVTYGSGSIKKNGIYDQTIEALSENEVIEFGGIEPNPDYETLMKAVEICKKENIEFLLSVGGGSVLDGTKFIAAATHYPGDPWDILTRKKSVSISKTIPLGCVMTLAATGSEMNGYAVISRRSTGEKLSFGSPLVFPVFSILDPQTTMTLPVRQSANGVIDAFIHVTEQYLTFDNHAPLQDRQSEAILRTLVESGQELMTNPDSYETRATIMWCATQALNGLIGCGVAQDWTSHTIGHELTAAYGLDHARSLAVVFPAVVKHQKSKKFEKVLQYGKRVWHIIPGKENKERDIAFEQTLQKTTDFFHSMGLKTTLKEACMELNNIDKGNFIEKSEGIIDEIALRISKRGVKLGEHKNIGYQEIKEILYLCRE